MHEEAGVEISKSIQHFLCTRSDLFIPHPAEAQCTSGPGEDSVLWNIKYKFQGQSRQEAEMGPEHVECVDSLAGWMRTWLKVAISRK